MILAKADRVSQRKKEEVKAYMGIRGPLTISIIINHDILNSDVTLKGIYTLKKGFNKTISMLKHSVISLIY